MAWRPHVGRAIGRVRCGVRDIGRQHLMHLELATKVVLTFVLSEGKRCIKLVARGDGAGEPNSVSPPSRSGLLHRRAEGDFVRAGGRCEFRRRQNAGGLRDLSRLTARFPNRKKVV